MVFDKTDSIVFASMTHLNFQLENEMDPFKSIVEGNFYQNVLPFLKLFL